jgi:hypothetical protein
VTRGGYGRDAWGWGLVGVCLVISALMIGGLVGMWMMIDLPTDPRGWYYLVLAHLGVFGWIVLTLLLWGLT